MFMTPHIYMAVCTEYQVLLLFKNVLAFASKILRIFGQVFKR